MRIVDFSINYVDDLPRAYDMLTKLGFRDNPLRSLLSNYIAEKARSGMSGLGKEYYRKEMLEVFSKLSGDFTQQELLTAYK